MDQWGPKSFFMLKSKILIFFLSFFYFQTSPLQNESQQIPCWCFAPVVVAQTWTVTTMLRLQRPQTFPSGGSKSLVNYRGRPYKGASKAILQFVDTTKLVRFSLFRAKYDLNTGQFN